MARGSRRVPGSQGEWSGGRVLFESWTGSYDGCPQEVLAQPRSHRSYPSIGSCPPQPTLGDLCPLTPVAEGQPPLLACLNVGHPQVAVVDKGEEGGVGRADFGVHPRPGTLGLDFERLHGGHLGTERPSSEGTGPPSPPPPPLPQPGTRAHHEAILAPIPTVEEAIAGLEKEKATLTVEVIGGDAEDP